MDKNQIFIKNGTEYKKMTKELLAESNLAELIGDRNKMVGIKPNLVSPSDPSNGGTTHPEIVAGILEYLKENGFQNMMILEGSWVGDRTADAFEVCGYRSLCEDYDVRFYDTQKDKSYVKDCSGLELKICESVKKNRFSYQCAGHERTLSDKNHLCAEKHERADSQHRKKTLPCNGTAQADRTSEYRDTSGLHCG